MMALRSLLYIILLSVGISTAAAQTLTFRSTTEEVQIHVFAANKGKPIENLQPSDFEVFDNGVKQIVQYARLQRELSINAMLVFDISRSVEGQLLEDLKDAARTFLSHLRKEDQAGLITFNQAITLDVPLTHNFKNIELALNQTKPERQSSLYDACYACLAVPKASSEPLLIIIFSDGLDTDSWLTRTEVLEAAKHNDAIVYSITTLQSYRFSGSTKQTLFLDELAKATNGSLYFIGFSGALSDTFLKILEDFRLHYLVTYTPQGVSANGWHKLEVRLKNQSLKVKSRPGYMRSP
jgi:Ca-activated chloride channel homolog